MVFNQGIQDDAKLIFATVAIFVLLQAVFFPTMYVSIDEHEYIKNSFLLTNWQVGEKDAGYACRASLYNQNGYVSSQFMGRSIFLLPFLPFGLFGIMASGLLIHLANFAIVFLVLKRLGVPRIFSLLYLLYPAFVWSSRTVYPELLVLTGFLAGLYFFLGSNIKDWLLAGFFFSTAVLTRYDAIFGLAAFITPSLFSNRKKAILIAAGAVPIGAFILLFNTTAYSGALGSGHAVGISLLSYLFAGIFDIDNLIYFAILVLIYPLMLLSPYISKRFPLKAEYFLFSVVYFAFNSAFTSFLAFPFSLESVLTSRLRYLIPLIGLLLIPYAYFVSTLVKRVKFNVPRTVVFALIVLMLSGAGVLSYKHSSLLGTRTAVLDAIYAHTPEGAIIIGSSDDCIYFQRHLFPDRKYYNVDLSQDLANNPEKLSLGQLKSPDTYVVDISYSYLVGRKSDRQGVIDSERKKMQDFLSQNKESLVLIHESSAGVRVYQWN